MTLRHRIYSLLLVVVLASCGGSGSLERASDPENPTPDPAPTSTYEVTLALTDVDGNEIRNVSQNEPGQLVATLSLDGDLAAYELVQFSVENTGVINPSIGTALTNESGQASVTLLPGTQQGAGRAIVTFSKDGFDTVTADFSFTSAGDAPAGNASDYFMGLDLFDGGNTPTTNISATNPGVLVVTVRDGSGTPVVNRVVQFTSTLGEFSPASGTALTDSTGTASIILNAGSIEGAGEVTATYDSASITTGFYTQGDQIDPNLIEADVSFDIVNCPENWDRQARNKDECTVTNNISPSMPGILFIEVDRTGTTQPLAEVLVVAETTIGKISPDNRTAITDNNGIALLDLLASSDVGAGQLSVTAINTTTTKAFQIGAADVSLSIDNGLADGESLNSGSTTVVSVSITDNDTASLYQPPVSVEFSSNCSSSGQAVLDESVVSIGGIASATYRADGCVGDDQISATAIVGGEALTVTTTISVVEAVTGSIEFVSATPEELALKGTGGLTNDGLASRSETSVVVFRVVDENGNPDPQEPVRFELSTDIGGVTISPTEAFSNNDGLVQTVVTSGTVPTSVRVVAIYDDGNSDPNAQDTRISTVSDKLVISTGLPDQNSFSLSVSNHRPEGLQINGTEDPTDPATVEVTAYAADHFNNPVPDGTTVFFTTEGGSVEPNCQTTNGKCSVLWWAQDPRPFANDPADYSNTIDDVGCFADYDGSGDVSLGDGVPAPCLIGDMITRLPLSANPPRAARATITAHTVGEETFTDLNGNGVFDSNEFNSLNDLAEAFVDHNENLVYDGIECADASNPCEPANSDGGEYEEFFDFDNDGLLTPADNKYNGLLCTQEALNDGICNWELLHVRDSEVIVMAGSTIYMRSMQGGADINAVTVSPGDFFSISFLASDLYGNLPPTGSTVRVSASKGSLKTSSSFVIADGVGTEAFAFTSSVEIPATEEPGGGALLVEIETPSGVISSHSVSITVN